MYNWTGYSDNHLIIALDYHLGSPCDLYTNNSASNWMILEKGAMNGWRVSNMNGGVQKSFTLKTILVIITKRKDCFS